MTAPVVPERIRPCCVGEETSLIDALRVIDQAGFRIALVVDREGRLLGTLTDGDVRRALLKGAPLSALAGPHVRRDCRTVGPEATRSEVLDLMQALVFDQVPIVDGERRLLGLHLLHDIIGPAERPNWAVLMAGGKGTRLHPITETVPKPMVRVAGRPILERLVLHLVGHGVRRIFLSVNHLAGVIEDHFKDGSRFGCRIDYLREDRPLGTGGSLSLLPSRPAHPLLVMNGDLVTQVDLSGMLEAHGRGGRLATVGVGRYAHPIPYGCVASEGDRLRRLEEKPVVEREVNAGIYVLDPSLLDRIPRDPFPITALLEGMLERDEPVGVYRIAEEWVDVGHRDQLRQAQQGL